MLTAVKEGHRSYHVKNSKDLLEILISRLLSEHKNIKKPMLFQLFILLFSIPTQKQCTSLLLQKWRFTYIQMYFLLKISHSLKILFQIYFQIHGRRCYLNAGIYVDRQYIFPVWRARFSTNVRHSEGNKLCSYTCWSIPLLIWVWLYSWYNSKKGTLFGQILWPMFLLYRWRIIVKQS